MTDVPGTPPPAVEAPPAHEPPPAGAADDPARAARRGPPRGPKSRAMADRLAQLERLSDLRERGALSDEELAAAEAEIMRGE